MTSLAPRWVVGAVDLTDVPYMVPFGGADYGAPENVTDVIRSMFTDGDYEVSSKAGNRTLVLPVYIEDSDLAALAEAEAALEAECRKARNEVYVDPGDGFAEPFVFDVFRGQMSFARSDDFEMSGVRAYTLTFRALPYARSTVETTTTPTGTSVGTARQHSYSFTVDGSARTEASLHVGASASLVDTLIYTRPGAQGMIPLRQYRTGGGATTADATLISGTYDQNIETAFAASAPKTVVPDGTYILFARLRAASGSGTTTITSTIGTKVSTYLTKSATSLSASSVALDSNYRICQLGEAFRLPAAVVADESNTSIAVSIQDAASGITVRLDEAWLVEIESGALTWPDTAAGIVGQPLAQHVWVDPPSVDIQTGRLLRGAASDQSDAFGADAASLGIHYLEPGTNTAFVVTSGTTTAALTVTYWPRWHTHSAA